MESFEDMLTGVHPNSLGRTVEVVDCVLADPPRIEDLYACYHSTDEVVRLRSSPGRVEAENHDLLFLIDRLIEKIGALDQPSAQWTLAKLFEALWDDMSARQKGRGDHATQSGPARRLDRPEQLHASAV